MISQRALRDFQFFKETKLDMIGYGESGTVIMDTYLGVSALEAWDSRDTYGKTLPCREPEILSKVERAKKSWNLQIKMWAESMADPPMLLQPELRGYCNGLPEWVFEATLRQAGKLLIDDPRFGYVPRFARLEKVYGNWWPPHMDNFDPSI